MHATRPKRLFPPASTLFANACNAAIADATSTTTASTSTSRTEVICFCAPSQSIIVSHLASTAGGSAIAAASVAQAAGLSAVLRNSGAYIFASAGGYVAGTIGTAATLSAMVTVGVVGAGTAATLELICASTNHPELAAKVKAAASEFMTRNKRMVAESSEHTVATAKPFIAEFKTVGARVRADVFEYADNASIQLSETLRPKRK